MKAKSVNIALIKYINSKLVRILTPIVIVFVILLSACGPSILERETIDNITLKEDYRDIDWIYSFTLKSGKTFTDSIYSIGLNFKDKKDPRIIYNGPDIKADSAGNFSDEPIQSFSIFDVKEADVIYKKSTSSIMPIVGPIIAVAVIVFIFWANGERNKRQ